MQLVVCSDWTNKGSILDDELLLCGGPESDVVAAAVIAANLENCGQLRAGWRPQVKLGHLRGSPAGDAGGFFFFMS